MDLADGNIQSPIDMQRDFESACTPIMPSDPNDVPGWNAELNHLVKTNDPTMIGMLPGTKIEPQPDRSVIVTPMNGGGACLHLKRVGLG